MSSKPFMPRLLEVDSSLRTDGVSTSERRSVLEELECQINEMLNERGPGDDKPTVGDVRALLAEMDPPEKYCDQPDAPPISSDQNISRFQPLFPALRSSPPAASPKRMPR